jgi:hypothetical protein
MGRSASKSSANESVNTAQRNDIVIRTEPVQVNQKTSQPSLVHEQSQRFWHKKLRTYVEGRKISEADPDYAHVLAINQPNLKKWLTIGCICFQQISMNLNASILPSAYAQLQAESGFSESNCTHCTGLFLIAYAFGCELCKCSLKYVEYLLTFLGAPWSEESGRKKTLEASQVLVNLTQVPQLAVLLGCMTNTGAVFGTMLPMRILGGLCSAGGSVTLGIVSDMVSSTIGLMLRVSNNFLVGARESSSTSDANFTCVCDGLHRWSEDRRLPRIIRQSGVGDRCADNFWLHSLCDHSSDARNKIDCPSYSRS